MKEPSKLEIAAAFLAWAFCAGVIVWLFVGCSGCWDATTQLFLK